MQRKCYILCKKLIKTPVYITYTHTFIFDTICPKHYAQYSRFVVFYCGWVPSVVHMSYQPQGADYLTTAMHPTAVLKITGSVLLSEFQIARGTLKSNK